MGICGASVATTVGFLHGTVPSVVALMFSVGMTDGLFHNPIKHRAAADIQSLLSGLF